MYTTNISAEFINRINSASRHFRLRLTRLDTNTELDLTYKKATFTSGSCGGSSFAVGCSFASTIDVEAIYSDVLLEGVEVFAEIGLFMGDDTDYSDLTKYEYCPMGYYTLQKPTKQADEMTFTGVDRMNGALSKLYETHLTYPATISAIVNEIATLCGVTIRLNSGIGSQTLPSAMTAMSCRDAIQILSILSLGYSYVSADGVVVIESFKNGSVVAVDYDLVKTQPQMDEAVSNIEGVQVEVTPESVDEEGEPIPAVVLSDGSGYQIKVGCSYMTDAIFNIAKSNITGLAYNGGSVSFMGNPLLEVSDRIWFKGGSDTKEYGLVDDQTRQLITDIGYLIMALDKMEYSVPCMQIVHEFDGGLLTTVTAPGSFETTENTTYAGAITRFIDQQSIENEVSRTLITYAKDAAIAAQQAADDAQESADDAMRSATNANRYANDALGQLATVEDVVETLTWIAEHGSYALTTDTTPVASKTYFTLVGTAVANPTDAELSSYYELWGIGTNNYYVKTQDAQVDQTKPYFTVVGTPHTNVPEITPYTYYDLSIDDSVTNYVATHLALTNEGLFVLLDDSGYKVKITNTGVFIIDDTGAVVAKYSTETVIGNDQGENSFMRIEPQKISAHKKNGDSYFETGDLNGMVFTETFTGTGTDITFRIKSNVGVGSVDSVTVNGESVGYSWDSHIPRNVTLDSAPASGSEIAITYTIAGDSSYTLNTYFTFGTRDDNYAPGAGSVSFGEDNRLGYGFAYGVGLVGNAGFGPGVSYFGRYNDYSRFYPTGGYDLFVVGNGANDANRSNAFRVDAQGNAFLQGEVRSDSYLLPETEYAPSAVTVRSGEITSLCDITLEANSRYLIVYGAGFATNANGYRKLHLAVNSNTAGRYSPIVRAVDGEQTRMNASLVYTNTSSSSLVLHLWAQQNSGSDLVVYGYAHAIKI